VGKSKEEHNLEIKDLKLFNITRKIEIKFSNEKTRDLPKEKCENWE